VKSLSDRRRSGAPARSAPARAAPARAAPAPAPALGPARARIDALDDTILKLLEERADIAREVAAVKRAAEIQVFHDPERERQVLDRLVKRGGDRFPPDAIRAVFREVMSACLSVEEPLRVAYLGPEGTFS